ncbi:SCAN domain-containing protein 3 [Nephila pilipes]|uniref:SCAN domain-containing protein 3 n=1 Tax=Nephila pilipes TaxID=299642 RepID=A0A8X6NVI7_NEPPI|nr:SCAN domain-containing protein 3 [Nephila pilipes]
MQLSIVLLKLVLFLLLIVKSGKSHTVEENLIKPSIAVFLKMALEKVDKDVKDMPLTNAKCERLLKLFCEERNEDLRLILHTEIRWILKGNCLKRFVELFDTLSDFLSEKPENEEVVNGRCQYLANCSRIDKA